MAINDQIRMALEQYEKRASAIRPCRAQIDSELDDWANVISNHAQWIDINWSLEWESPNELRFLFTTRNDNNRWFVDMEFAHLTSSGNITKADSPDDAYDRAMRGI